MSEVTVLNENNSALTLYDLSEEWQHIVATCAKEIDATLQYKPQIKLYGKICHQHRSIGFYSNDSIGYKYSGQIALSQPLTPLLQQLLDFVNTKFTAQFNGILVNKYEGGEDYISAHSDDEK